MPENWPTGMRLHKAEDWPVPVLKAEDWPVPVLSAQMLNGAGPPCIKLRRVGWLDQKGRVWLEVPPGAQFDGGSLTPLLIDARDG